MPDAWDQHTRSAPKRPFKASHAGVHAPADNIRTNRRLSASPMISGQAIRNTSYATVFSVIREIEIWRVAVLMVNRLRRRGRGEKLHACRGASSGRRSRWGGYLASDHCRDRAAYRHNGAAKLIMVQSGRGRTHMSVTEHRQGTARFRMLG